MLCSFYLEDVRYGVIEMFPLLSVEVLELSGVLVLTLISRVRAQVMLGFGLNNKLIHNNIGL